MKRTLFCWIGRYGCSRSADVRVVVPPVLIRTASLIIPPHVYRYDAISNLYSTRWLNHPWTYGPPLPPPRYPIPQHGWQLEPTSDCAAGDRAGIVGPGGLSVKFFVRTFSERCRRSGQLVACCLHIYSEMNETTCKPCAMQLPATSFRILV